jgi:Leucine-rich repeat (LRR) protein
MVFFPNLPKDILLIIFEYANRNGDIATVSRLNKFSLSVVFTLMQRNLTQIKILSEKQNTSLSRVIRDGIQAKDPTTYIDYSRLFHEIVWEAQSLSGICPSRILEPQEFGRMSIQIDQELEKIWPKLANQICLKNQGLQLELGLNAQEIRTWLFENPDLLQKVKHLDLQKLNLKALPPEIGLFRSLISLNISENQILAIPSQIGSLVELREFIAFNNALSFLPPEFANLKALKKLHIASNRFITFPKVVCELGKLEELYVFSNQLLALPEEIAKLKKLKHFHVNGNQLKEFPSGIGSLTNLLYLQAYDNQLLKLTPEIRHLKSLQLLNLNNNQLKEIPEEIGQLQNLELLNLHRNQLTDIPSTVGSLNKLIRLFLSQNFILKIPAEIGKLGCLLELYIANNLISELPIEVKQLQNLTVLDISNNQLRTIPFEVDQLPKLKYFVCLGNYQLMENGPYDLPLDLDMPSVLTWRSSTPCNIQ